MSSEELETSGLQATTGKTMSHYYDCFQAKATKPSNSENDEMCIWTGCSTHCWRKSKRAQTSHVLQAILSRTPRRN